ncbi:MAG: sirohydrochlorin cobaltochelatase [Desulfofustis sp.]|nr:sirohydrochlorin cobaltochelatase [Desulfofustis sp.]NNK56541.1 sirohydrochlorin cobaltochelatase [Desulfofustis sp.]
MLKLRICVAVFLACGLMLAGVSGASHHGEEKEKKVGILLVAFGSSEDSAQVSFENIDKKVKATYPGIPVKWAYTSHIIRKKLAGQGKELDSPEVALAKMADEDFTHVAVQSLHTIGGAEYHDLHRSISAFTVMGAFENILLGYPLLATQEDLERTVEAILANIPAERNKEEAVVLMGHGTHHPSNAFYSALNFQVQLRDPYVFIGTVEGYPELDTIQALLQKNDIKKVYLMPFMSVAGDHAKNDMAGDEDDSWKSILTKEGYEVVTVLKGTAEFDEFVEIWVDHVRGPMSHF